jgi:hypothetical protein
MALVLDSPVPAGIWSGYGREMLNGLLGYSVCSRPDTYQCSYPDCKAVSFLSLPWSILKQSTYVRNAHHYHRVGGFHV